MVLTQPRGHESVSAHSSTSDEKNIEIHIHNVITEIMNACMSLKCKWLFKIKTNTCAMSCIQKFITIYISEDSNNDVPF